MKEKTKDSICMGEESFIREVKEKTNSHGEYSGCTSKKSACNPVTHLEKLKRKWHKKWQRLSEGAMNETCEAILKDIKEKNKYLDRIFVNNFNGFNYCPDWIKGHFTKIIKRGIK